MEDGALIDPPSHTNSSATVIPRDNYQVPKGDSSMFPFVVCANRVSVFQYVV